MKRLAPLVLMLGGCGLAAGLGDYRVGVGDGGAGGDGGVSSGGGGEAPACVGDEDCDDPAIVCWGAACVEGRCELAAVAKGEVCSQLGGDICDGAGNCVKADGKPCSVADECASGFCVDDQCCAEACDGPCVACDLAAGAGSCLPVAAAVIDGSCDAAAVCDGSGQCAGGDPRWGKRYGDAASQIVYDLTYDAAGNLYMVGEAAGTFDFGGDSFSCDGIDAFLVKLDANGNHVFSKIWVNPGTQQLRGVKVDPIDGSIVLGGNFTGNPTFDGLPLVNGGSTSMFVLKLDAAGQVAWLKDFDESNHDQVLRDVGIDTQGNIWMTGGVKGTINFGAESISSASTSRYDAFAIKLDAGGVYVTSGIWGGAAYDQAAFAMAMDGDEPLFTGRLRGSFSFGGDMLTSTAGTGLADVFVLKLDAAGNHLWSRSYGGPGFNDSLDIAVDAGGHIAVAGRFEGNLNFGNTALVSMGGNESAFVGVLDPLGDEIWSAAYGDSADDGAIQSLAFDSNGNLLLLADFEGAISFGGPTYQNPDDPTKDDVAVAKLAPDGTHLWSRYYGDGADQFASAVAVDANGNVAIAGELTGDIALGITTLTSAGSYDAYLICLGP